MVDRVAHLSEQFHRGRAAATRADGLDQPGRIAVAETVEFGVEGVHAAGSRLLRRIHGHVSVFQQFVGRQTQVVW